MLNALSSQDCWGISRKVTLHTAWRSEGCPGLDGCIKTQTSLRVNHWMPFNYNGICEIPSDVKLGYKSSNVIANCIAANVRLVSGPDCGEVSGKVILRPVIGRVFRDVMGKTGGVIEGLRRLSPHGAGVSGSKRARNGRSQYKTAWHLRRRAPSPCPNPSAHVLCIYPFCFESLWHRVMLTILWRT